MTKIQLLVFMLFLLAYTFKGITQEQFERDRDAAFQANQSRGQQGSVVTVGGDVTCDFSDLQTAVNSQPTEVRMATNSTYTDILLNQTTINADINLVGGFDDCTDAANNVPGSQKAVINGSSTVPAINISGSNNINVSGVILQQAVHGIRVGTGYTGKLSLHDVVSRQNRIGILVLSLQSRIFAEDLVVTDNNNPSGNGSGIRCDEASIIDVVGNSSITNNRADNGGAGITLQNNCVMTMVAGDIPNASRIAGNIINTLGGGIAVFSGARFIGSGDQVEIGGIFYGNDNTALRIEDNETAIQNLGFGGGIYVSDSDSVVDLSDVVVSNNEALRGGGIYANDQAQVFVSQNDRHCWSDNACNLFISNEASQAGGAVYLIDGARVEISNSRITGHRASRSLFALVNGQNSELIATSNFIDENGDSGQNGFTDLTVLTVENGGLFSGANLTIVDNLNTDKVLINDSATLTLSGSYVYNPLGGAFLINQNQGVSNLTCLFVDAANNLAAPGVTLMSQLDYSNTFENPFAGNYRTQTSAVGLDQCSGQGLVLKDIDLNNTGYDDPNTANGSGPYDVGAHENIFNDIIFKNGFEPSISAFSNREER